MDLVRFASETRCLDGSPAGYYFRQGLQEVNNWVVISSRLLYSIRSSQSDVRSFQIFLEGSGWCFSEEECLARADTTAGSSLGWPERIHDVGGVRLLPSRVQNSDPVPDLGRWYLPPFWSNQKVLGVFYVWHKELLGSDTICYPDCE